MKKFSALIE